MAQNPLKAPTGMKGDVLAAVCCCYYGLCTTFVELLKVSTGTTISFWQLYCQTACLPGMLLTSSSVDVSDIVLGRLGFLGHCLGKKT
jgi:hypothetical protein